MSLNENRTPLTAKEKLLVSNIKNARLDAELTQEELSYQIGKNSNYIGMIESHRRRVSFKTLFKIASTLNIKVKELFEGI